MFAVAAYVLYQRHQSAAAASFNSSGTPGPGAAGASAQQPSGGASSVAGNLPPVLVSQPDTVQTQVQRTDAGGSAATDVSSSTAAAVATSGGYSYVNPTPAQLAGAPAESVEIGSTYYTQSSPGSDYMIAEPPSHPGTPGGASQLPAATIGTNVRRPGFQPDA